MDTNIEYEGVTLIAVNADALFNELDRKWQKTEFYDHCCEDMETLFGGDGMNITANIIYHIDGVNDTDECGNDIRATVPDYDDAERVRNKIVAMNTFCEVYGNCTLILEIGDDNDSYDVCLQDKDGDYLGCLTFLADSDEDEIEEDEDDETEFVMVQSENDFDDLLDISATKSKTQPREKGKSSAESVAEQAMAWLAEQTGFNTRDDR